MKEIKWATALRLFWWMTWRSFLVAFLIGFVIGFTGALIKRIYGMDLADTINILNIVTGFIVSFLYFRKLFNNDFGDFKVLVTEKKKARAIKRPKKTRA